MKQATTYTNLIAICPHCDKHDEIDEFYDCEELEIIECSGCGEEYSACLPESEYHDNP